MSPTRILLQTTLSQTEEDWSIGRFSLLQDYLRSLKDEMGNPLCAVTARDRYVDENNIDPVLSTLDRTQFDQLWLFALDTGDGLSAAECAAITRFHQQSGGILATRDHQDMGLSMCALKTIGLFHYFNTRHLDPDPAHCQPDDIHTPSISFPNFHSGANGDYQVIQPVEPVHELLLDPNSPTGVIQYFPAHPHEGGVGVDPSISSARVIARGLSQVSKCLFNLVVASDFTPDPDGHTLGRVVAQSTFHHFVDYNWDTDQGCPYFVSEPPGDGYKKNPEKLQDIKTYIKNLVLWLDPKHLQD